MRYLGLGCAMTLVVALVACGTGGGDERGANGADSGPGRDGSDVTSEDPEDVVIEPVRVGSLETVIPRPLHVTPGEGEFPLTRATILEVEEGSGAGDAAELLRTYLTPVTRGDLPVVRIGPEESGGDEDGGGRRVVRFASGGADLGDEGYRLRIRPERVEVSAGGRAGFGWAAQTLRQLLPPVVERGEAVPGTLAFPAGDVRDRPRFPWRGVMLDVARHFFPPEDVARVIDVAAAYKLNTLHLHLTDDQGWRLEIRSHPELTATGARTEVGGGPGGFYTQDEYRRLVERATRRGVTVVPEIDMPGHTNAALTSIPELNCDGQAPAPYTGTRVGFSSLCVDRESTYQFVDEVIGEVAELTPGPYIHIGGDEARRTTDGEYRRFVERAAKIVRSHGKIPVGWDEVATVDVGPDAVAQYWRSEENAVAAARQGMGVVMSPAQRTYLDMAYGDFAPDGNDWAGMIDTRAAYSWDPGAAVAGVPESAVRGIEAPLWTELVTTLEEIQLRMLPRLPGYAELGWSPGGEGWDAYRGRLASHVRRWEAAGWPYTRDPGVTGG